MGLQQSRQACALPKPAAEPPAPPPERYDGLIPRSLTARQACNARRVRRLIRAGRLAPCFDESLSGAEGEECPVCMEHYRRLNSTACCQQDICTECFICVVAPGGVSSRCPYCQAHALQVYLRPLSCHAAEPEAEAEAAAAGGGTCEAAAAAAPTSEAALQQPAQPSRPPSSMDASGTRSGSSGTARAGSTASSGLSMAGLDLEGDSVPVTAFLAPAPAAAARAAMRQHQEQARRLAGSPGAACPGTVDSGCSSVVPVSLSLGCDLRLLAEAAANASRADGPAIVAMVRRASEPDGSSDASGGSGSEPRSDTDPGGSDDSGDHTAPSCAAAAEASAGSEQQGVPAAMPDALPEQPRVPAEGGPVLLQLPDGSEQLVLLRSAQQDAAEEAAALAAAWERQQQQAADAAAALPSYQPPASREDERVRLAIAQADASLRQHRPASASPAAGDWLERMRQADAALQAAVARSDAQHFGGGASDGAAGSGSSEGGSASDGGAGSGEGEGGN